jgi:hypothetical protein
MSNIHCHVGNLFLPLNFKFIGKHKWNILSIQQLWLNVTDFAYYADYKYEKFDYKFYNQYENYRNFATTAQIMNISNIIHFDFSVEVSDMKCLFIYIDIMLDTPRYFRHLRLADEVFGRLVLAITYGLFFTTNEKLDMLHLHNYLTDEYAILRRLEQKNYIECNCRQVRDPKCQHFSTNHLASKGENVARNRYLLEEVKRASVEEVKILDKKFEDKLKGRLSNYKYCNICYSVHEGEHVVSWPYFLVGHPLHDPRLFYLIYRFSGVIPVWSSVNKNEIFDRIILYEELLQN